MILKLFFGGLPKDSNPILWALAKEIRILSEALLGIDKNAGILPRYADHRNPKASSFASLLFARENAALKSLMTTWLRLEETPVPSCSTDSS